MANILYPNRCAWAQKLPPKYEEDMITQYWVVAHFSCIQYHVPVWPWPLTYFPKNWVTWPRGRVDIYVPIWMFADVFVLKHSSINCRFSGPWLGNRRCHGNHFGPHSLGCPPLESRRVWSWCDHPLKSYGTFYLHELYAVWPRGLTYFHHNWVT